MTLNVTVIELSHLVGGRQACQFQHVHVQVVINLYLLRAGGNSRAVSRPTSVARKIGFIHVRRALKSVGQIQWLWKWSFCFAQLILSSACNFVAKLLKLKWDFYHEACTYGLSVSLFPIAGLLSTLHPAKDPVSAVHQESTVQHPEDKSQPLPILSPEEMHRSGHESRR